MSFIAPAPSRCRGSRAACVRLSVALRATAHHGPESRYGATEKFRLLALRIDREAHELTVNFQIGEESCRIFMKMQHRIAAMIEGAAFLFGESVELSDFAENRFELVKRL